MFFKPRLVTPNPSKSEHDFLRVCTVLNIIEKNNYNCTVHDFLSLRTVEAYIKKTSIARSTSAPTFPEIFYPSISIKPEAHIYSMVEI